MIDEIPTTDKIAYVSVSQIVKKPCKKKKEDITRRLSTEGPQKPLPELFQSKPNNYFEQIEPQSSNRYSNNLNDLSQVTHSL